MRLAGAGDASKPQVIAGPRMTASLPVHWSTVRFSLPTAVRPGGVFGGEVAAGIELYIRPQSNALTKVQAGTVHVTGSGGSFQTPARLLGGVGTRDSSSPAFVFTPIGVTP
ncbi:hypothetical protein [Lentzea sp. NPDC059081]|uniref:hypothetical protein n=1 Tax=Lentzea sp. NPDC059081 TaxID=3346719 RepID=UPI003683437F